MTSVVSSIMPAGEAPASGRDQHSLTFESGGRAFTGLCLRAAVLTAVTLGIYRFWFLTDARRFLWGRTGLGSDQFEYVGTGKELFLGSLVAIGILLPAYLLGFVLSIEADRIKPFSGTPIFLALSLLGIFASYRARRYRLTRTVFRGLRFGMGGSTWRYVLICLRWSVLTGITLGLAYPWMAAALERYKMRNTFYGDLTGDFVGSAWQLFKAMVVFWILGLCSFFLILGARAFHAAPLAFIGIIGLPLSHGYYKGCEWRWWVQGVRLGPVSASPRFGAGFVLRQGAAFAFLAVLFLIAVSAVFFGFVTALNAAGLLPQKGERPSIWLLLSPLPAYLVTFIGLGILYRRFLQYGVWASVAGHVAVSGVEALDSVQARDGGTGGAVAEALADALDFGF